MWIHMQYCPKCKTLQQSAAVCEKCQEPVRPPEQADMVLLAADVEYEINNLCAALSQQNIPFQTEGENRSMSSFQSRGFRGSSSLFVRYGDYDAARQLAEGLGFSFPKDPAGATVTPLDEDAAKAVSSSVAGRKTQPSAAKAKGEKPEVSPAKRRLGKVLLYLSILAAVVVVVLLSDTILGWLKGLFGG